MKRACPVVFVAMLVIAGCNAPSPTPPDPLHGAWRMVEMYWILADGDTVAAPAHESLFLFSDGFYSIGYAFGRERMEAYAERWHPTDAEKATRFSSMIVNAGTYELHGSRIHATPLFALAPAFVGGEAEFFYTFTGDTLELSWDQSVAFDGLEYPGRGIVTLHRLVRLD